MKYSAAIETIFMHTNRKLYRPSVSETNKRTNKKLNWGHNITTNLWEITFMCIKITKGQEKITGVVLKWLNP